MRRLISYVSALATGLLVIGVGAAFYGRTPGSCEVDLAVTSSTEKVRLITQLAEQYGREHRRLPSGGCATIRVDRFNSGAAAQALATGWTGAVVAGHPQRPDVWLPSSSMWVTRLRTSVPAVPAGSPSLAHSPLVIAMSRPMATALGWPAKRLTWRDVLSLDKDVWDRLGHPEWDRFTYAKDDPTKSTSGLAATVATFYAAAGKTAGGFTAADAQTAAVRGAVRQVEANVVAHPPDIMDYLEQLRDSDSGISAMVLQEQLAYLHNEGNPSGFPSGDAGFPSGDTGFPSGDAGFPSGDAGFSSGDVGAGRPGRQFVAIHPADGTLVLDHPYVALPGLSAAKRAAAADFLAFLREPESRQGFAALGFRDEHDTAPPALAKSLGFDAAQRPPSVMPPPSAAVMDAVLASWRALSKRANILLVVDKSGSMAQQSRMATAKRALTGNLKLLNPDDRVELWSFASDPADLHPRLWPPARVGDGTGLTQAVSLLHPASKPPWDTALCVTIRDAQRALLERATPDTINAVVVLTDGRDDYAGGKCAMSRTAAGSYLGDTLAAADPSRRVRVFGIAFGKDADEAALRKIANGTGGVCLDATRHPERLGSAFADIFTALSPGPGG